MARTAKQIAAQRAATAASAAKRKHAVSVTGVGNPKVGEPSHIHKAASGKLAPARHTPLQQAAMRKSGTKSGQKPIFSTKKKHPSSSVDYGKPRSGLYGQL